MPEHRKVVKKNIVLKIQTGALNEHEDCYGTFEKLVRNSEFSRSDNFKKLSVLAQILSFL